MNWGVEPPNPPAIPTLPFVFFHRRNFTRTWFAALQDRGFFGLQPIWTMTSAVNVRSQLIRVIFVFISIIIQCDASTSPGKVLHDKDLRSIITGTARHS